MFNMEKTAQLIDFKEILLNQLSPEVFNFTKAFPSLQERRDKAIRNFTKNGFPSTGNEEWKYTDLRPVWKHEFSLDLNNTLSKSQLEEIYIPGLTANNIIFFNGVYVPELSSILDNEGDLKLATLKDADPAVVNEYFGIEPLVDDPLYDLNLGYFVDGLVITVPKGKASKFPTVITFVSDATHKNIFAQPRVLIIGEENAQGVFIENFHTIGNHHSFTNTATEVYLKGNANLSHYKVQKEGLNTFHVGTLQVNHLEKSYFNSTTITFGGNIVRNNLNISLNREISETHMNGLYFLSDEMHVDNHTLVSHNVPNCFSNELYKGVLSGKSSGVFNGKILVKKDAQKTNAFQANKNILLSKDALMNTKPQLEIFADDVKCSHGATIGQLDEDPLFYLRTRGISEGKAKALLTLAFAEEVLERIQIIPLRDFLKNILVDKFSNI